MKKVISLILVACMLLCLCACGNDNVKSSKNSKSDDNELLSRIEQLEKENSDLEKRVEALENDMPKFGTKEDSSSMEELHEELIGAVEDTEDDGYEIEEEMLDSAIEQGYVRPDESVVVDIDNDEAFDYSEFFSE